MVLGLMKPYNSGLPLTQQTFGDFSYEAYLFLSVNNEPAKR